MAEIKTIEPQEGYQTVALESSADILIGGGAAGVGKTFTLLLEPLRHIYTPDFGAVIFRRTSPMIRAEGGLWDSSVKLYSLINGAVPKETKLNWTFASGVKINFSHMELERNMYDWQGSEIPFIGFDELTQFSRKMFFYLLSRNRSTCGVKPYVRATCNPEPDSWVSEFIDWWIGKDGYPIPERQGVLRYFMVDNNNYIWGDSKAEVIQNGWHILQPIVERSGIAPEDFVKSLTFVGGSIYDNKELLTVNPQYLGNLNAQDADTKERLLLGNWKRKKNAADIYSWQSFADIFTNDFNREKYKNAPRTITTDIAMKGSDKMVIMCWQGKMLVDFKVLPKTKGNEVINAIKAMCNKWYVPHSRVVFDNDGVGQFVDGFITGAKEFNNGAKALNGEAYANLKSQCFFKSGASVARNEYFIPAEIAQRDYDDKQTLRERLMYERKAAKQAKPDHEGKLRVIPKNEMKPYLNGASPDVLETFMMREFIDLAPADPEIYYS